MAAYKHLSGADFKALFACLRSQPTQGSGKSAFLRFAAEGGNEC